MTAPSHLTPPKGPASSRGKLITAILLAVLVMVAFLVGDPEAWLNHAIRAVENLGAWGPLAFGLVYVVATVLMVPGSILTLSAGALFGLGFGTVVVSLSSTAAAALAFLIGRFLARDLIAAQTAKYPAFAALERALRKDGWKIVALTRLSPVFPFTLLNYAFGLTRVKFTHYVAASWIAMLPATFLFVYLGSLARAGLKGAGHSPLKWTLYGVGLAATIAVTVIITRLARRAVAEAGLDPETPESDRRK